ncbi:MAG: phosphoribosyl-AMP cyclohydrolase [Caldivirga sp.]|jgi:phosphoribosyl-AMP cyclohydrolase|uniref:phosphoribosyl-AMP cyclohydrolase n=1 Tax=Caldivirga sp. MU80 TaxID=1650354 RepID=UPI000A89914A|nr:phosphoribosyl-AMP cyclohydrolase [Caldivirga sp. MU80]
MLPDGIKVMRLSIEDALKVAESLWYRHTDNTVIAVAQDWQSKDVLMVASMNKDAVVKTLTTGMVHYWSLSRKRLWLKGETSGHYQYLVDFRVDCDGDALLLKVYQIGNACHLGTRSCFDARYVNKIRLDTNLNTGEP